MWILSRKERHALFQMDCSISLKTVEVYWISILQAKNTKCFKFLHINEFNIRPVIGVIYYAAICKLIPCVT